MSETRADGDGASASKKPRVEESENETEHVVSITQMVSGHYKREPRSCVYR